MQWAKAVEILKSYGVSSQRDRAFMLACQESQVVKDGKGEPVILFVRFTGYPYTRKGYRVYIAPVPASEPAYMRLPGRRICGTRPYPDASEVSVPRGVTVCRCGAWLWPGGKRSHWEARRRCPSVCVPLS